jgi:putative oxidoreductase
MKKLTIADVIIVLMLSLFLYTGFSKFFDFENFKFAMHNQPFPEWFSLVLAWFLPSAELSIAGMLLFDKTQKQGLLAAAIMMLLFTLYTILIILHFFPAVPCPCGGIIKSFTWREHFLFNLFFLLLSLIGYVMKTNETKISSKNISRAKSG